MQLATKAIKYTLYAFNFFLAMNASLAASVIAASGCNCKRLPVCIDYSRDSRRERVHQVATNANRRPQ